VNALRWACVVATLGAAAYLLADPVSVDHAAQLYRVWLVRDAGLGLWDNGWYGGHHTLGYSVLYPPLGALAGARVAGALACVAAAALFAQLARRAWGERAGAVAAIWFAAGATGTLFSGRLTFMLGVAVGLAALLALQRARRPLAAGLAILTSLASPVAGLFVAIAAVAWGLARRDRRAWGAVVAACALAPPLAFAVLFAEGGTHPFAASAFWPLLGGLVLVAVLVGAPERELRLGAALYALACAASFAVANPLGGNATRLGALFAGPVVAGAWLARRQAAGGGGGRAALAAAGGGGARRTRAAAARGGGARGAWAAVPIAALLAYWQLYPAVRDVVRVSGDPSTAAAYHVPLLRFLEGRPGTFRVEIPFTESHWEAAYVAPHIPLARGWERQLDRRYDALFYDGTLDAARYRAWLDELAVAYVALPDVALDASARAEGRLVARGLPYLRPVWHDAHWRVFAVRRPTPLVAGVARTIALRPDGFAIAARRPGDALVRIRHTRWWAVTAGRACVRPGPDGMTRVQVLAPGTVRVQARLTGPACRR
jgi:hypothetical protein